MTEIYSKSPWKAETLNKSTGLEVQIKSAEGEHICSVNSAVWQNNIGNSKLIEFAPESYRLLKEMIAVFEFLYSPEAAETNELKQTIDLISESGGLTEYAKTMKKKLIDLTGTKI